MQKAKSNFNKDSTSIKFLNDDSKGIDNTNFDDLDMRDMSGADFEKHLFNQSSSEEHISLLDNDRDMLEEGKEDDLLEGKLR